MEVCHDNAAWKWPALFVGVCVLECLPGPTLSEIFRRGMETRWIRNLELGSIAVIVSHLVGLTPDAVDPINYLGKTKGLYGKLTRGN